MWTSPLRRHPAARMSRYLSICRAFFTNLCTVAGLTVERVYDNDDCVTSILQVRDHCFVHFVHRLSTTCVLFFMLYYNVFISRGTLQLIFYCACADVEYIQFFVLTV